MPKLLGVVPLERDPKTLGKFSFPYYLVSRDGLFLRNKNVLGEYFIKQKYFPEHLQSMGDWDKGFFRFNAPRIPKEIVGQILDFFRKVYEKDKTEAEVLLLFNPTTKEYKVFVPWQICTGASVHSLYDPAEIPNEWIVIGSMHSHCNFSAFHSGTDTADASVFNGLHVTIGHVNSKVPSWAVMVMVNEQQFTFKDEENVLEIENLDALDEFTAPDEWFEFIKEHVHEIVVQDFKSLGKKQLDDFERTVHPVIIKPATTNKTPTALPTKYDHKGSWNDDDFYQWWNKSDNKPSSYQSTRFNEQVRRSLPSHMLDQKGDIKSEFILEILTKEVERLYDIAQDYYLNLDYEFIDMVDDTLPVEKDVIQENHFWKQIKEANDAANDVPIRVLDVRGNTLSESRISLDDDDDDLMDDLRTMDDIHDFSGEDGFFRAMSKIMSENQDQDVIDRKIAQLINMED